MISASAEGQQQPVEMIELVQPLQQQRALDEHAEGTDDQRRQHQARTSS